MQHVPIVAEPVPIELGPAGPVPVSRPRVATGVVAAAVALAAAGSLLAWLNRGTAGAASDTPPVQVVTGLAYAGLGAVILGRGGERRIARLLCLIGLCNLVAAVGQGYLDFGFLTRPHGLPDPAWALFPAVAWLPSLALTATVLVLVFPSGRLPSARWRPVLWLAIGSIALAMVSVVVSPGQVPAGEHPPFVAPGWLRSVASVTTGLAVVAFLIATVASAISLVARLRRARGLEREQLRWFAYGAALLVVVLLSEFVIPANLDSLVELVALLALPAAAGTAILRHQLYDIDVVIARSVVYGGLTAGVVGGYAAIVAVLELALQDRARFGVSVLASGAVALAFGPLRARLQRAAERLVYGQRSEPFRVLSDLGRQLEAAVSPDRVLPAAVDTLVRALRLPHAAIELHGPEGLLPVAVHGAPVGVPLVLPLVHHGLQVGRLTVSPRGPGEGFTAEERDLVEAVARHAGVAAQAVQLTAGLQRSRMRLVTAREEERRRLRRDLHDGLGPTLAGVTLRLDAARREVSTDPRASEAELLALREEVQEAIASIRELVYELRPPALDELGLVGALRERAARLAPLRAEVSCDRDLAGLPAAVEVAAYRIAQEALTNVTRHARATRATISLEQDDARLLVEVTDDGAGLPDALHAGVGLGSMRERAEELGGRLQVLPAPGGGTTVRAWLPVAR